MTKEPSARPRSAKESPTFKNEAHRALSAGAFSQGADLYDRVRPTYPQEAAALIGNARRILDVGAGTGRFTEALLRHNPDAEVLALDPSADMTTTLRARLGIPVWLGTAEATGLLDASVDAVTCAQTWHWVDVDAACREFNRIVRPGGRVVLAWNTIDVSEPWVLRLARIMHSGDIQREGFMPEVRPPWHITQELRTKWGQRLFPRDVLLLAQTRSYWLRSNSATRERVRNNLNWYLFEHLGFDENTEIELPYRTDAFLLERAG